MTMIRRGIALVLVAFLFACVSEDAYQAQLDKYGKLSKRCGEERAELDKAKSRVAELEAELKKLGAKLNTAGTEAADMQKALAEYKKRAEALERLKQRYATLQTKLKKLTNLGLDVSIRRNRMVISLPGDVLFDSGKDELKDEGKEILKQVAEVIRGDRMLKSRFYQVAGHTDNAKLRRQVERKFYDNWGLSVMRARGVLVFLVRPTRSAKGGGGLRKDRWSAAGYGATDPVGSNRSPAGRKKNRRVELILLPDVEELLDLQSLVQKTTKS